MEFNEMLLLMDEEYIRLLVEHTKSTSEAVADALVAHMLEGLTQEQSAKKFGLSSQAQVSRLKSSVIKLDNLVKKSVAMKNKLENK
ncbi:hypothetical protein ACK3YH_20690 [Aeromonas caviae]|uniref:hypothetical protein n=1 Tax=Aeromonas TaxID=642 RepID=UPI000C76D27F|nr:MULTISPECIES: hypothetical protein [Aeromonas]KAE9622471.1 hypothetical protein GO627_21215 [Aeromonas veronii]MDX7702373.1 hypothetical protein [Aeromonas caviae]MDX7847020.1 hypothetical protein [Aeromonas caviae]